MDLSDASHESSGTRAALELRVLSGRQQGARALLASDGAWTTLGRHPDNDLVLREAPFEQAEIGLVDGQWWWRQGPQEPQALAAGHGIRMQGYVLQVCSPSRPWTTELPEQWAVDDAADDAGAPNLAPEALAHEDEGEQAQSASDSGIDSDAAVALQGSEPTDEPETAPDTLPDLRAEGAPSGVGAALAKTPGTATAPQAGGRLTAAARGWAWVHANARPLAGSAALMVLAAWWSVPLFNAPWGDMFGQRPGLARTGAAGIHTPTPEGSLVMPGAVQGPTGPGGVQVHTGPVGVNPGPEPLLTPVQADLQSVQRALSGQPGLAQGVRASVGPSGRVVLRGVVVDDEALETLLRPIIREGIRVQLQVLTAREFELRVRGLKTQLPAGITGLALPDGTVKLEGTVKQEVAAAELERTVALEIPEALAVQQVVLTQAAVNEIQQASAQAEAVRQAALPPMRPLPEVVALMGGPEAAVVLADGLHLGIGGQAGVWRVAAVSATSVTFVDPQGRRRSLSP